MTSARLLGRLRPRSRRQYIASGLVIAIVIAATTWWTLGRADSTQPQTTTATAATGTFQQTVTGTGTLASAKQADLGFDVSGRVADVAVEAGDKVAKGDVLATLDTLSLDAALASAQAQAEAAATTVANDGSDTATQRAANEASLASARADVVNAQDSLAAATLTAPFSGTVASVSVEVGDQAGTSSGSSASSGTSGGGGAASGQGGSTAATSSSTTSTAAIVLVKPTTFVVDVDIAADQIAEVEKGLQVEITPTGAAEPIFGTVKTVGKVAETSTSGTATFPVTVSITGAQKDLYSGTTASVSIIVKQVQDVLTVPTQAVTTTDGKTYVDLVDGSSTKKTAVTIGETYGMSTEITKGLKAGDVVKVAATGRMRAGGGSGSSGQDGGGFPGGGTMPDLPPGGAGGFPGGGPQ